MEKNMSRVQLANMTDEELLRHAYMEKDDPLVQELCTRVARLIDENAELKASLTDSLTD
jgi:hypothetical protein